MTTETPSFEPASRRQVLRRGAGLAFAAAATGALGGAAMAGPAAAGTGRFSPVIELRRYTMFPGQRDTLIDLFEREFIESQEALGVRVIGTFRDLDDPNRFLWLRGFPSMEARGAALNAFYFGPVWKAHRTAANATLADSDDVRLLRPATAESGFLLPQVPQRAAPGTTAIPPGFFTVNICAFARPVDPAFVAFFERQVKPVLTKAGATVLATLVTEPSANNFPRLPVREGEHTFLWVSSFADRAAYDAHLDRPQVIRLDSTLQDQLLHPPEVLRLQPTARSGLHR